jgi:hypothetical protein
MAYLVPELSFCLVGIYPQRDTAIIIIITICPLITKLEVDQPPLVAPYPSDMATHMNTFSDVMQCFEDWRSSIQPHTQQNVSNNRVYITTTGGKCQR